MGREIFATDVNPSLPNLVITQRVGTRTKDGHNAAIPPGKHALGIPDGIPGEKSLPTEWLARDVCSLPASVASGQ